MPTTHGNYRDYINPASQFPGSSPSSHVRDARLILLESLIPELFQAKTCLDIGCNTGNVACQVAFDLEAASVTGVDIDPELVKRAGDLLAFRSSRFRPPTNASARIVDFYPISALFEHGLRFGSDSTGPHSSVSAPAFLEWPKVTFISADWVLSKHPTTSGPYDVILALSVIKWIHLEHLDEGLVSFFHKSSSSLAPGGYFVVELQAWDSYEKAIRPEKAPHFAENLKKLKYRPETSFNQLLQEQGLNLCATSTALPRRISIYRKDQPGSLCGLESFVPPSCALTLTNGTDQ